MDRLDRDRRNAPPISAGPAAFSLLAGQAFSRRAQSPLQGRGTMHPADGSLAGSPARFGLSVLVVALALGPLFSWTEGASSAPAMQDAVVNLLSNGDFEDGLSGWSAGSGIQVVSDAHSGINAVRFTSGSTLMQIISGTPGRTYKVTLWVKINPATSCSGDCWGGFQPGLDNWTNTEGDTALLTPQTRPVGVWFKESFRFVVGGPDTSGELKIGPFASQSWHWDVVVDDVKYFEVSQSQLPPTVSLSADRSYADLIPAAFTFTSVADDADGSIAFYFWDFGDGGKSNLPHPVHTYVGNGTYTVRLLVYDDDGMSASSQTAIQVNDPRYPTLEITSPAPPAHTTSNPHTSIQGTAAAGSGSAIARVEWSTDRGQTGIASGTASWQFDLDLSGAGGRNRVLVNAFDGSGRLARKELVVEFHPAGKVGIASGANGVTQNTGVVEQYGKFEATFQVVDSVASLPYLPHETDLPPGMLAGAGITVEGTFTSPSGHHYSQPGFLYQPYEEGAGAGTWLAVGDPVWKIRFAPQEIGDWTYTISVTDGSGTTTTSDASRLRFTVVQPTNPENHGFIRVSQTDHRYFEFSDGTPFIGLGPGAAVAADFEARIAQVGEKGANLARTWMSADNIGGSSWGSWTGRIDYEGNYPGTSLTTDEGYGDGIFSLTFPQTNGSGTRCSFYGFQGPDVGIRPNTNYRILIRLKVVDVQGSGGFTFRPGVGWPDTCDDFAGQATPIAHIKGTRDWHVVTGTWNSGGRTHLGNALITLENVTGGRVYIDEISMREDLGNGRYGPEILPRSKFNVHTYFTQEPSLMWDRALDAMAELGMYQKIVIEEKGDYSFNHISPYGYAYDKGGQMQVLGGASHKYQQYYWRYLTARFGYSRAVHSWEYVNEDPPGRLAMANEMAGYFHSLDPQRHLATTSFWCCLRGWDDPAYTEIDYADSHAYVTAYNDNTSWLGTTDPFTGGSLQDDLALYVTAHSLDAWTKGAAGNKPIIMAEAGVGKDGVVAGDNDSDTQGVWLHHYLWAQVNPGAMYFIYWYPETIRTRGLYPLFRVFRQFMEGKPEDEVNTRIPLANGHYADIGLTLPSNVYGWGQKDVENGGAHFWMYDRSYNWTNPGGGSSLEGKSLSLGGLPSAVYTVEWWNTWTGDVLAEERTHSGGVMSLQVPSSFHGQDVAVKIYPRDTGYSGQVPPPQPTFADVPFDHSYHDYIEALYQAGYTAGCNTSPLRYCPDQTMNRAESAVFVERGIHGTGTPPPAQPSTQTFADLPLDSWAAKWAEALWLDHYTAGCGTDPLIYCPWQGHTRAEGCVFYLHMLNGPDYAPPQPTQQTFADVPLEAWYAKWVQAGYEAGLLTPCQTTPDLRFCPNDPLSRALAAYMMVQAKGLAIP